MKLQTFYRYYHSIRQQNEFNISLCVEDIIWIPSLCLRERCIYKVKEASLIHYVMKIILIRTLMLLNITTLSCMNSTVKEIEPNQSTLSSMLYTRKFLGSQTTIVFPYNTFQFSTSYSVFTICVEHGSAASYK